MIPSMMWCNNHSLSGRVGEWAGGWAGGWVSGFINFMFVDVRFFLYVLNVSCNWLSLLFILYRCSFILFVFVDARKGGREGGGQSADLLKLWLTSASIWFYSSLFVLFDLILSYSASHPTISSWSTSGLFNVLCPTSLFYLLIILYYFTIHHTYLFWLPVIRPPQADRLRLQPRVGAQHHHGPRPGLRNTCNA